MAEQKLLRVSQVAKIFNVSRPTVYRMVNAGKLEAFSISDSVRIPAEAVSQYLENHRIADDCASGKMHIETPPVKNRKPIELTVAARTTAAPTEPTPVNDLPKSSKVKATATPTAEMLLERKAWKMARLLAVKILPADASAAQWDKALKLAYAEAVKKLKSKTAS